MISHMETVAFEILTALAALETLNHMYLPKGLIKFFCLSFCLIHTVSLHRFWSFARCNHSHQENRIPSLKEKMYKCFIGWEI